MSFRYFKICLAIVCLAIIPCKAQEATQETYWHGKERSLRYTPVGEDFVIVNGDKKFNRALYGTNSGFRVETGDLPEFGLYMPNMGGNLQLGVIRGGEGKWLNDAQYIKSVYRPGARIYEINDPFTGQLQVTTLAMGDAEGMIIRIQAQLPDDAELFWTFGGASDERFWREGDLGVDDPDCFALKPAACSNNIFSLSGNTFTLFYGRDRRLVEEASEGQTVRTTDNKIKPKMLTGAFPEGSRLKLASPYAVTTPVDLWESEVTNNQPVLAGRCKTTKNGIYYLAVQNAAEGKLAYNELENCFRKAEDRRQQVASTVKIQTPDPYFNTLGGALSVAADGIWEPDSWLHGAIGWRMRLNGWRAAYVGDAIGWHDRARGHFDGYAASQTTGVEPVIPHPAQDIKLNMARADKRWGTQMYSNGYICRNPNQTGVMHHYDMNLCYIDELLWHFNWTGDMDYVRQMWPVLERHLAWEKRNFDPDNDGLYDAYCCIWASDALQYNSGGVTHSSAYNYRANRMAAEIAGKIGKDPKPYAAEADKILKAINRNLWLDNLGRWAEYKDFMGHKRVHPDAAVWTVYHAIDSEVQDIFQGYQATRYIDTEIPHIPVRARGLKDEGYATIGTTNWLPYSWSINNVAFAEVHHTALAYWQSGRYDDAFRLLKSSLLDGMYLGSSPGNFGQVSFYDAARGECYRDFGDPVGITSRTLIQGLFGIIPDAMNGKWTIRPGFPQQWDHASISTPDVSFDFRRTPSGDIYTIDKVPYELDLYIRAHKDRIVSLTVNGKKAKWTLAENAAGYPLVRINCKATEHQVIRIEWGGTGPGGIQAPVSGAYGDNWQIISEMKTGKVYDPQKVLASVKQGKNNISGTLSGEPGHRTLFVELAQGQMKWWQPVHVEITSRIGIAGFDPEAKSLSFVLQNRSASEVNGTVVVNPGSHSFSAPVRIPAGGESGMISVTEGKAVTGTNVVELRVGDRVVYTGKLYSWNIRNKNLKYEPVDINRKWNASVTRIFRDQYLTPRSPYTTLQVPTQGIGEWCHPLMTADIDDSGLRKSVENGLVITPFEVPFRTASAEGADNITFTSLWDNYPDKVDIPLSGKATHAYLMMAGSTNHMQCHMVNATVTVTYGDGTTEVLNLVNPETWAPIEQDFFVDGQAFRLKAPEPYRVHLKSGLISRNLGEDLRIKGVDGRRIDGGAGIILDMPLDNRKELMNIRLETLSTEVVVGLMGITLAINDVN